MTITQTAAIKLLREALRQITEKPHMVTSIICNALLATSLDQISKEYATESRDSPAEEPASSDLSQRLEVCEANISALRAGLCACANAIGPKTLRYVSTEFDKKIDEALAVTAPTDAKPDVDLADALNTMLWLYHRLPRAYGRPPHIDRTVSALAKATGTEVDHILIERGHADQSATGAQP